MDQLKKDDIVEYGDVQTAFSNAYETNIIYSAFKEKKSSFIDRFK